MPRKAAQSKSRKRARRITRPASLPQSAQLIRASRTTSENGPRIPACSNDRIAMIVTRMFDQGTINASNAADNFGQFTVGLSSLPNSSEFTTLFDQYRITRCEYTFQPLQTVAVNSTTASTPGIFTVVDYDDSTTLTTLAQALQYPNVRWHSGYEPFTVSFKPHIAMAAYSGAFTSFANTFDQWLDVSSPAIVHYGLKYCALQNVGIAQSWRVVGKVIIELKNVR